MKEKTERNLRILIHLSEGAKEEEEAIRNNIRQPAVHNAAQTIIRKLIDDEQINYLSVRGALIQQPEITEIAKSALERLQQLRQRGIKPPHKFDRKILESIENL